MIGNLSYDQIHQNNNIGKSKNINFCINDSIPNFNNKVLIKLARNPFPESAEERQIITLNNNMELIPLNKKYNLRYGDNYTYNDLEDSIKNIINNPKYSMKRCKSAYSKKSVKEKFEEMKLKVPKIKNWNCDPTAEIIIRNLEQKVDILSHENFLLTKKLKDILLNNKELKLDLSQKMLLLKTEQEMKNNEKDIDIYKNLNLLKTENEKLKIITEDLKNERDLYKEKYNDFVKRQQQLIIQFDNEKYPNDNQNENIDENIQKKFIVKNDNFEHDLLLNENENLHHQLQKLLVIEEENDDENNIDINNINDNIENNNDNEFINKKNLLLKEKINHLTDQLDIVKKQKNIEINNLIEKIKLLESQLIFNENNNKNLTELDKILNECILLYINAEDDEAKQIIATVQNIKNIDKKRLSQCVIINSKLKTLIDENNFLHNQMLSVKNDINKKTYDHLIKELKEKDKIIEKYKSRINLEKSLKPSFDYFVEKIVNNQKEVLGERAPRFDMSKSQQFYYDNNTSNESKEKSGYGSGYYYIKNVNNQNYQNYNNYHYKSKKINEYNEI